MQSQKRLATHSNPRPGKKPGFQILFRNSQTGGFVEFCSEADTVP